MRIVILAMDDPLYTNRFIKQIIDVRHDDIVGFVYVSKGNRMTIGKDKSKAAYLFSLLLIMGMFHFFSNSFITILHKIRIKLSKKLSFISSPLVIELATKLRSASYARQADTHGRTQTFCSLDPG